MNATDHVLKKLAALQDQVRNGSINAQDIVSRLDYITEVVKEMS